MAQSVQQSAKARMKQVKTKALLPLANPDLLAIGATPYAYGYPGAIPYGVHPYGIYPYGPYPFTGYAGVIPFGAVVVYQ